MTRIYHADLWGSREDKYRFLQENDVTTIQWTEIFPKSPFYLFVAQDKDLFTEYETGWKITEIMPTNTLGFQTHRDHFAIDFDREYLYQKFKEFRDVKLSDYEIKNKHQIKDNRDWKVENARKQIRLDNDWEQWLLVCLYRPFDWRHCYFSTIAMDYPRYVLQHSMTKENLSLLCSRQQATLGFHHVWCTDVPANDCVISTTSREANQVFPLYIYPDTRNQQSNLFMEKSLNLSSNFITAIREKLGYIPTPEAIFYYIYAIFHSPTYRQRYAEFLKIDFPRVPLTSNNQLFQDLGVKGKELVDLHLMKSKKLNQLMTKMAGDGDNGVTEVTYKLTEQRIYINKTRYFEGIPPEVWEFKIGGYQVLDKWLKDRKKAKLTLSFDDVLHYHKVVVALKETMQIMEDIDQLIPSFPIE
ncbi:type ISP restriction/modification enzyme [Nodularia chucula]|uniref:type ISP restriction/modification enzyme n=1 Tax=Nodularia chucula TaxID=3093667 RepID=UPI0039C64667